jgi:hypothetical protein
MPRHLARCVLLLASSTAAVTGCFSSDSASPPADASIQLDGEGALDATSSPDATGRDAAPDGPGLHDAAADAAADAGLPGDAGADARVCPPSTCTQVKVIFQGFIPGADGGNAAVEIAVDDATADGGPNATIVRTARAGDPAVGHENVLVGDFVTQSDGGLASPLQYSNDNNACDVPDFAGRSNEYYLAPMQGLPVDPAWYHPQCGCGGNCGGACVDGGVCDFESALYSQTCPNFGFNCVMTPRKIEAIVVTGAGADGGSDSTCEVCLYASTTPSPATLIRCVAPGATLSSTDLYGTADGGASPPALLRLDDGTSCASY